VHFLTKCTESLANCLSGSIKTSLNPSLLSIVSVVCQTGEKHEYGDEVFVSKRLQQISSDRHLTQCLTAPTTNDALYTCLSFFRIQSNNPNPGYQSFHIRIIFGRISHVLSSLKNQVSVYLLSP
jgi:hypothetical protein